MSPGFAKGGAMVSLADKDGGTLLSYNVEAQIGGKLAQLGQRLINSAAKKTADDFFERFKVAVGVRRLIAQSGHVVAAPASRIPTKTLDRPRPRGFRVDLFQTALRGKIAPILIRSAAGFGRRRENEAFGPTFRRKAMSAVAMTVNGKAVTGDVDPRTLLVQFLREHLRLTGTHVGCDTSQCGACVVHVDGKAVKSCTVFAWQLEGANVITIEGLADPNGPLHPMQEAFRENHGLQCGYCTPGMIMTAVDMVNRKGNDLDDHTIRHELEGNLCRCTGYHNIVKAIAAGAKAMAKA